MRNGFTLSRRRRPAWAVRRRREQRLPTGVFENQAVQLVKIDIIPGERGCCKPGRRVFCIRVRTVPTAETLLAGPAHGTTTVLNVAMSTSTGRS